MLQLNNPIFSIWMLFIKSESKAQNLNFLHLFYSIRINNKIGILLIQQFFAFCAWKKNYTESNLAQESSLCWNLSSVSFFILNFNKRSNLSGSKLYIVSLPAVDYQSVKGSSGYPKRLNKDWDL